MQTRFCTTFVLKNRVDFFLGLLFGVVPTSMPEKMTTPPSRAKQGTIVGTNMVSGGVVVIFCGTLVCTTPPKMPKTFDQNFKKKSHLEEDESE